MLGSPAGPGGPSQRGLWPLAPAPAPSATSFTTDGFSKCGVYSLFPGSPTFGSAIYSHARTIGQFTAGHIQQSTGNPFYHKADALFSTAGYTFGAPTPPPGSPYSPVPVAQLELLTKGFSSNIIVQSPDYPLSPKKAPQEQRCDEKCCKHQALRTAFCNNCNSSAMSPSSSSSAKRFAEVATGCSRTNPIEWTGVNVKKEPGATPCQVAEVSTSVGSPIVKLEVTSPRTLDGHQTFSNCHVGNIPVGIAVARQRLQQEMVGSPSLPPAGLLTTVNAAQIKEVARISEIGDATAAGMAASLTGGVSAGGTLLQCTDERGAPLAGWPMGGAQGSALATPTLWQYPAPVPLEPMLPLPVPMPPVGFQLVRDPTTGGLLLLPTAGIESVVWPSFQAAPPLLLPPMPPPPLQLLTTTADYLTSTTLQHTQTRLLALPSDPHKRKPALIKLEEPLTTHLIYQHPNLILSQAPSETICRSQATSPVTCLTPPPEIQAVAEEPASVQDASNQTEAICSEDDSPPLTITEVPEEEEAEEASLPVPQPDISGLELLSNSIVEFEENGRKEEKPPEDHLGGLDLLCALAEQRIREEKHKKRKRKRHSEEPSRKKRRRSYKTPESETEVKKFIASKSASCEGEWPLMNEMELDMRMKLADLQRQYREKQKELSELKPHKKPSKKDSSEGITLKPPVLCPKPRLEAIKQSDRIINDYKNDLLRQRALEDTVDRTSSSSKKRKVGRPKKLPSGENERVGTETIVAKKPKHSFVGYLLAAKEKLQLQNRFAESPPRFVEEDLGKISRIRPQLKAEVVAVVPEEEVVGACVLTKRHLEVEKLRVLTAMGGLFYAGLLNAVEAPDVYSITLDGERGNRPHIMSREEILRDAIVEVAPKSTQELVAGTRLCAYWSQQYRCLYPGSVAEPGTPDPDLDSKFVAVEFDDGDSGRIALEDIRLLPDDYPIIEYDPNPLLSLSKRRRRSSAECRRRVSTSVDEPVRPMSPPPEHDLEKENRPHKDRKRLKKKKRDKLKAKLLHSERKKRRKHKCTDDPCKHKKHHKKHRKHKKHHHEKKAPILEEVTVEDIPKQIRPRQESCESRSKMSAFLPARKLWGWSGKGYKRPRAKGRSRKQFFKAIQRGKETITVGDSAVFLSTGRPDRPYIGKIEAMWEMCGTMVVKVKWFYHPEETQGCPENLQYPGALFESPHVDENDVQTISHKCEVLPLGEYKERLGDDPRRYEAIYDNNDIYYLAGYYDPTNLTLKMEDEIPVKQQ